MSVCFGLDFFEKLCYDFCMRDLSEATHDDVVRLKWYFRRQIRLERLYMAEKPLLEAPLSVSTREIEQFKMERIAENQFIIALAEILEKLREKVGNQNRVVASMDRFLRSRR